jgi:hypothetical protein
MSSFRTRFGISSNHVTKCHENLKQVQVDVRETISNSLFHDFQTPNSSKE